MSLYKFEIDEIWANRLEERFIITCVKSDSDTYPLRVRHLLKNYSLVLTKDGTEIPHLVSDLDLITFIGTIKDFPEYLL